LRAGREFFLAFSPEREDPGNKEFGTATIPKVVGGLDPVSGDLAQLLYDQVIARTVRVTSARAAEATKLVENIFRAVNIALVNECKLLLERAGIDVWETLAAAGTKPFGFQRFAPGPGTGGQCIPVDPQYYTWIARQWGGRSRLVEEALAINRGMPGHVVECTRVALARGGRPLRGARVLLLGVAYKKDVDITCESPALEILRLLADAGAAVGYCDPHVEELRWSDGAMRSSGLDAALLSGSDAVVLVTDHSCFDYRLVAQHARLVVDTRHAFAERGLRSSNVIEA
jgi:UDP-N-acetyl-D-glucosamine dehydrogenase